MDSKERLKLLKLHQNKKTHGSIFKSYETSIIGNMVHPKQLTKAPLIEAVFELYWALHPAQDDKAQIGRGTGSDPNYSITIGTLYNKVKTDYPYHEKLPTSQIPESMAAYIIQHRYRKAENVGPLIQIGPGLVTLNITKNYTSHDFKSRSNQLATSFCESYPDTASLRFSRLIMRYINFIPFDFEKDNILDYLKENLNLSVEIKKTIFAQSDITDKPHGIDIRFSYPAKTQETMLHFRFVRSTIEKKDCLIWEIVFETTKATPAQMSAPDISAWIEQGHAVCEKWFFNMCDDKLIRVFE